MADLVEEALDVGVEHPAAPRPLVLSTGTFGSQAVLHRDRRVLNRAARPEPVRVRLEHRLPFGLQRELHQALHGPVFQRWNAQGSHRAVGLRDEDPTNRRRSIPRQAQTILQQPCPVLVGGTHDSVDAGCFAPAVLLGDLADGQQFGGPRRRQEALQGLHLANVPPDLGHEDAVLEAAHVPLDLTPLDVAPVGCGERPVCVGGFPRRQHAPVGRRALRGHLTFTPSAVVEFCSTSRWPGTSPVSRTLPRALAWSTIFGLTLCAHRPSALRAGRRLGRATEG